MEITILDGDDWTAVYRDGEKIYENHSCPLGVGLEALGVPFEQREVQPEGIEEDDSVWTGNEFPESLS